MADVIERLHTEIARLRAINAGLVTRGALRLAATTAGESPRDQMLKMAGRLADEYVRQTGDDLLISVLVEALGSAGARAPAPTAGKRKVGTVRVDLEAKTMEVELGPGVQARLDARAAPGRGATGQNDPAGAT